MFYNVEEFKNISIVDYLQKRGIVVEPTGRKWFCSSPFTRDSNWSFCIYPNNTFYCWSTGKSGDVITLVKLLENCSFQEALNHLSNNSYEEYKANYKKYKQDDSFWKDFDYTKYINTNSEECKEIYNYGLSRSICAGYEYGVYFTRSNSSDTWSRNPALMFVHVDHDLKPCGAKFRNINPPIKKDGSNGPRFSARGKLGFYILDTEIPEGYSKKCVWLVESETSSNSLWMYFKEKRIPNWVISMGGVSSAPKELPAIFQGYEIRLIIDYDGTEQLYQERLKQYEHLNVTPIKMILPKGEDINSLYHNNEMYKIEHLLLN